MNQRRKAVWAVCAILVLLFLVAISIPSTRPKATANEAKLASRIRAAQTAQATMEQAEDKPSLGLAAKVPEKKLVHNVELGLKVGDVRAAVEQIQRLTESNHGEIDKVEITQLGDSSPSVTLVVRVPASGLGNAIAEFKKVAVRAEHEQLSSLDVTRQFYDNEAHMRNLRAEEQQYLAILKQAQTVKDTLEVAEKISAVRDRIERLQSQILLMTHDIAMSVVTIVMMQEYDQATAPHWRPLYDAKIAVRELLVGLGDWFDWIVALVIRLPLVLAWAMTGGVILWVCWRIGRYLLKRFRQPNVTQDS